MASPGLIMSSIAILFMVSGWFYSGTAQQYTEAGPFSTAAYTDSVKLTLPTHASQQVDITLTYPQSRTGPFPLVLAFSGFKCYSSWYETTVEHIASWGYAVLQYDMSSWASLTVGEREEVKYIQPLLDWLVTTVASSSDLQDRIDFTKMAVLGHSRGGKMATLVYANRADITTAVLLDPVDCGVKGRAHPSAVAALGGGFDVACGLPLLALRRSKKTAVVIGAGYVNPIMPCNPRNTNYESFARVLGTGSWKILIKKAGHMQFANTDDWRYKGLDTLCGHGKIGTEVVVEDANTLAIAWLEMTFRSDESVERWQTFGNWLEAQVDDDVLTFESLEDDSSDDVLTFDSLEDDSSDSVILPFAVDGAEDDVHESDVNGAKDVEQPVTVAKGSNVAVA